MGKKMDLTNKLKKELLILFIVYVVIDLVTTYFIIIDTQIVEFNPYVNYIITIYGWTGFIIAKLLVFGMLTGLSIIYTNFKIKYQGIVYSFSWAWNALFWIVVVGSVIIGINNIIVILI
jgi:hypothetical protein